MYSDRTKVKEDFIVKDGLTYDYKDRVAFPYPGCLKKTILIKVR